MTAELPPELLLFFVALAAGWIDTIAGGGGLLTLPALLLAGVPPAPAVATNKLQGSCGTLVSTLFFLRQGVIRLREMGGAIATTFLGAVAGSWLILQLDASALVKLLPLLLLGVGIYVLCSPHINDAERQPRFSPHSFALLATPLLGFYDGFFGPGAGSFMALALVLLGGYGLSRATANAKILNFTSNVASLLYFLLFGQMAWRIGLAMMAGQAVGATLATRMVLKTGAALIRPVVVTVCFAMAARLLLQSS